MKKKLGEVFVEAGLITPAELANALALQRPKGKRMGKVFVELGYANDEQVAQALSQQLVLPMVECGDLTASEELQAIVAREIAEKKLVFPLEVKGRKLRLAMTDPLDWATIHEMAFRTGLNISVSVSTERSILNAIEKSYRPKEKTWNLPGEVPAYSGVEFVAERQESDQEVNAQALHKLSEAPPIIRLVTMMLVDAVKARASDVHIEPMEQHVQVRYRIDGELNNTMKYPKSIHSSVTSRVKIISNLDITNRRLPQDGRSTLRLEDNNVHLRVSTLPSVHGEKIVIRLLDPATGLIPLSKLGVPEQVLKYLLALFASPQGMILVTGPTGSGKTTTLYALLKQMQSESKNVISIEDPVEYKIDSITQVGINEAAGFTFPSALRSILRQDPDVIMVGEIRDLETAEIAIRAAMTGHLVLGTVHTNNTVATIARLIEIGVPAYLVGSSVTGVLAQRLVRKICTTCKTETLPPVELIKSGLPAVKTYYKGSGCKECHYTGYRGRVGIYEFLKINNKLKRLIMSNASELDLWKAAGEAGIRTLFEDAWAKVEEGITTVDEVLLKIPFRLSVLEQADFRKAKKRRRSSAALLTNEFSNERSR